MKKLSFKVQRTAHYAQLGNISKDTKEIWFVIHGYGQLSDYFIRNFKILDNGKRCVIAPEGLSKFYIKAYSGRVGANWMTSESREDEIADYCNYLNQLYQFLTENIDLEKVQIKILGFSQGSNTASRWVVSGNFKVDQLILWGGDFARDLAFDFHRERLNSSNPLLLYGNEDEFIDEERVKSHCQFLDSHKISYKVKLYNGGHRIEPNILLEC